MMLRTSLFCFLLVSGAATSGRADAPTQVVRDESYLLNVRLGVPKLAVWDAPKQEWRAASGNEGQLPSAKIRILHLWGTYCKPCQEEFPLLKQIDQQLRLDYKGDVQFLYVADASSNNEQMKNFMTKHHAGMPMGLLFRDAENKLSSELLSVLPQQQVQVGGRADSPSERLLSLPMTLLLDGDNVVRMAVVGALVSRRGELVNAVAQLHRTISSLAPTSRSRVATKKGPSFQ